MGVSIKGRKRLKKKLLNLLNNTQKKFGSSVKKVIIPAIDRDLDLGISPVKKQRRLQKYSDSYKNQMVENDNVIKGTDGKLYIKKQRPVNLTVSGKTRKSIRVKKIKTGVRVWYKSNIMAFHNEGTDKMPRRASLPKDDEDFNRRITKLLKFLAKKSVPRTKK